MDNKNIEEIEFDSKEFLELDEFDSKEFLELEEQLKKLHIFI